MSGKGSGRRPAAISAQEFAEKWAQTFGKKDAFMASYRFSFKTDFVKDNKDGTYTTSDGRVLKSFDEVIVDAAKDVVREMQRSLHRAEANADAPNTTPWCKCLIGHYRDADGRPRETPHRPGCPNAPTTNEERRDA